MSFAVDSENATFPPDFEDQLRQGNIPHAKASLRALDDAISDEARFVLLDRAALACLTLGREPEAKKLAEESLRLCAKFPEHWNAGNAMHNGNIVLGLVALQHDDIEGAVRFLLAAGQTEGSPHLTSFGPNMMLAKRLLEAGRPDSVSEYLRACRDFWPSGSEWLETWNYKIAIGEMPNFSMHLYK